VASLKPGSQHLMRCNGFRASKQLSVEPAVCRQSWGEETFKVALDVAGSPEELSSLLERSAHAEGAWRSKVRRYCL